MEFPQLTMTMPDGREESIMKRTCLVGELQLVAAPSKLWPHSRIRVVAQTWYADVHEGFCVLVVDGCMDADHRRGIWCAMCLLMVGT